MFTIDLLNMMWSLFPNKAGNLRLDTFQLKVTYVSGQKRLGQFGTLQTKNVSSDPVYIEVKIPPGI